jgi:hypothetical protein
MMKSVIYFGCTLLGISNLIKRLLYKICRTPHPIQTAIETVCEELQEVDNETERMFDKFDGNRLSRRIKKEEQLEKLNELIDLHIYYNAKPCQLLDIPQSSLLKPKSI